jgi:hypothetical protein
MDGFSFLPVDAWPVAKFSCEARKFPDLQFLPASRAVSARAIRRYGICTIDKETEGDPMNRLHIDRYLTTTCAVALAAFGLGAAIMYILDPESGRRRRAIARDRTVSAANDTAEAIGDAARDLRNRAHGTAAEVKGVLSSHQPTSGQ